jgi:glutaredoxin 3
MKPVTVYTRSYCGYSKRAKALLSDKGVHYNDIDVTEDLELQKEMRERSKGGTTVPQIFIGDRHIGGFSDLAALDREGRLDALLTGEELQPSP